MSIYIIAIGGTGARFAEAIAHLSAVGLYTNQDQAGKLEILLVDPDKGNGNLDNATIAIRAYRNCSEIFSEGIDREQLKWWMQTRLEQSIWSPFNTIKPKLRDIFDYDDYTGDKLPIRHLFDVLYTPEERDLDLKEGFRGRPAIGSAIMAQLRQETDNREKWAELISKISEDYNHDRTNPPSVFLCGSIFGGTGASGFPTLGRLIANELTNGNQGNLLEEVKLGGLLMLPYFSFSPTGNVEQEIFARSEEFILKTEAALKYYGAQDLKFDNVYLLGMPTLSKVDFSPGGQNQRNQPHILELYAGLALQDFISTPKPSQRTVSLLGRQKNNQIIWDDLPDTKSKEIKTKLITATKFAFAWLSVIVPDLEFAKEKPRQVRWCLKFFNREQLNQSEEWSKINKIKDWCEAYLKWLGTLHQQGNGLEWFNLYAFFEKGKLKLDRDKFPDLVALGEGRPIVDILERLDQQGIEGENQTTVGLAKALYREICLVQK